MNLEGILNESDFLSGKTSINRSDYIFSLETGFFISEGTVVCRYWGKSNNIILLFDSDCGKKLKFSFWKNNKYCPEYSPKRNLVVENDSVRFLQDNIKIRISYQKGVNAGITRVRNLEII